MHTSSKTGLQRAIAHFANHARNRQVPTRVRGFSWDDFLGRVTTAPRPSENVAMRTDPTTKALLLAIAIGLWVHLAADFMRPTPVHAQDILAGIRESRVASDISNIASDTAQIRSSLKSIEMSLSLRSALK